MCGPFWQLCGIVIPPLDIWQWHHIIASLQGYWVLCCLKCTLYGSCKFVKKMLLTASFLKPLGPLATWLKIQFIIKQNNKFIICIYYTKRKVVATKKKQKHCNWCFLTYLVKVLQNNCTFSCWLKEEKVFHREALPKRPLSMPPPAIKRSSEILFCSCQYKNLVDLESLSEMEEVGEQ